MIKHTRIQIFHKLCIVIRIFAAARYPVQYRRTVDGFRKCPVHPVMYYRRAFPVSGIDYSGRTIRKPRILGSSVVKVFRRPDVAVSLSPFSISGERPLYNQSGPFDSVSRCGAIWFKRIVRTFSVTLQICFPFLCKMFRYAPVIPFRPGNDMPHNPAGPFPIGFIFECIRRGQKCLYCMHICIHAPVIIQNRKFRIPCITGQPFFLIPELPVINVNGFLQQFFCSFPPRQICGRRRQYDKCMGIALFCGKNAFIRCASRIPAAVLCIMQFTPQALQRFIHKLFAAFVSEKCTQTVDMSHTAGYPCLTVAFCPRCAIISQIVGTAARRRKSAPKTQKILSDILQESSVFRCVNFVFPLHVFLLFLFRISLP